MKVSAIQQSVYSRPYLVRSQSQPNTYKTMSGEYSPSFGTIPNSEPLRKLFAYGLPCIYSGVTMIDSALADKLIKSGVFSYPAKYSVPALAIFKDSYTKIQKQVFKKMERRSKVYPEEDLQEMMTAFAIQDRRKLRKVQGKIFDELTVLSAQLPFENQKAFINLMQLTDKKLKEKPIITTFNKFNFMYKMKKIKEDVSEIIGTRAGNILSEGIEEAHWLPDTYNAENKDAQIAIIGHISSIINSYPALKNYPPVQNLLASSIAKLNREPVKISFSRKAFLAELEVVLDGVKDEAIRRQMIEAAEKLPTSKNTIEAYIVKYKDSTPDKIAYRLMRPTYASVEHLHPKSMGGADDMKNFAGATVEENSARGNCEMVEQIKRRPLTPQYSQKYLDKLIRLEHRGIFEKLNIDPKYIKDFQRTMKKESNGKINLDAGKLYLF